MKRIIVIVMAALLCVGILAGCSAPAAPAASSAPAASEAASEAPASEAPAASEAASEAPAATEAPASEAPAADAADDSFKKIQDKGYFIMGLDDSFPPMGFRDDKGELVGFDIDMARAVAEHMGVKVELMPIDWNTKELELETKNIDLIWNGYTITEERKQKVLMSEPYMENKQVILVKADSPIKTLADLKGKSVAVQEGSSAQGVINEDTELLASISEVIAFKDYVTALLDIDAGRADALGVDLVVADYYMAKKAGQYVMLEETLAPEEYGIGFRKGEQAFHDAVAKAFEQMKQDGTAAEISNKWFGRDVTA